MLSLIQALQEFLLGWLGESQYALAITNAALVVFTIFVYWLFYFVVFRVFKRLSNRVINEDSQVQPLRIQKQEILSAKEVGLILNRTLLAISWLLRLWIIFAFVNTVLGLFEWTRDASKYIATFIAGIVITYTRAFRLVAAATCEHIEEEPAPFVLQTSLDDNYVAYELNAYTRRADLRPKIYSNLHANILDAFHTAGVEITSLHYRAVRDGNEAAMAPVIPRP